MALIKEVLDGKKTVNDLRIWYGNFRLLFPEETTTIEKYNKKFLEGSVQGFQDMLPDEDEKSIREILEKFCAKIKTHPFLFLSKEVAESAAFLHGYHLGITSGRIYLSRRTTQ